MEDNDLHFVRLSDMLNYTALCTRYFFTQKGRMRCGRKYAGYDEGQPVAADRQIRDPGIFEPGFPAAL